MTRMDDYDTVARLIYETDPYIYPDLFGPLENAQKVLKILLDDSNSIFYRNNYYIAEYRGNIVGVSALIHNPKWDTYSTRIAFERANVEIPDSFDSVIRHFERTFNTLSNGAMACNISVSDKCRNKGIAIFLLDELIKRCGWADIELTVLKDNVAACKLYSKRGFKIVEEFEDYGGYNQDLKMSYRMIRQQFDSKLPLNYDEREGYHAMDTYVFISYSHVDKEFVYEDLRLLYSQGARYWYDKGIEYGEKWDNIVGVKLTDPKCQGVIFFMSENLFKSEAVEREIEIFNTVKSEREDFIFIPISIGGRIVNEIVRDTYFSLSKRTSKELDSFFPLKRLESIITLFNEKVLFAGKVEGNNSHIVKIIDHLRKRDMLSNDESILSSLGNKKILTKVDDNYLFHYGKYPQQVEGSVQKYTTEGDFCQGNNKYRRSGSKVFIFQNIEWQLISMSGFDARFVSRKCLEFVSGRDIDDWLSRFLTTAFCEEERSKIREITLLSINEIEKYEAFKLSTNTEYSDSKRIKSFYYIWLAEKRSQSKREWANPSGKIVEGGGQENNICGVRPVITVNMESYLRMG